MAQHILDASDAHALLEQIRDLSFDDASSLELIDKILSELSKWNQDASQERLDDPLAAEWIDCLCKVGYTRAPIPGSRTIFP
jgi:hypothetical protein